MDGLISVAHCLSNASDLVGIPDRHDVHGCLCPGLLEDRGQGVSKRPIGSQAVRQEQRRCGLRQRFSRRSAQHDTGIGGANHLRVVKDADSLVPMQASQEVLSV